MKPTKEAIAVREELLKIRELSIGQQPRIIKPHDLEFPAYVGECQPVFLDRRGAPLTACIPDDFERQTIIVSTCQAPLSAVIKMTIDRLGGCDELILSTWAASGEDVSNIYELLRSQQLTAACFIVDPQFSRNAPTAAKIIVDRFGAKSLLVCQNHAKFAIIKRGSKTVLIRTSMNLDATPGMEYCTFDSGPIAEHVARHIRALFHATPLRLRPEFEGTRDEQRKAAAVAALRAIPDAADTYLVSGGRYSFIDVIEAVAERIGATTLHLSFWMASLSHIDRVAAMKCTTAMVCDKGIRKIKDGDRYARMIEHFGKGQVRLTATHMKFAVIGERVAILTSANLNDNPRNEDFRLSNDPEIVSGLLAIHGSQHATQEQHCKERKPGTLYIVRGLPGSGKSTMARKLVGEERCREADQFHMVDGIYRYDSTKAEEAHAWCYNETARLLAQDADCAVANTFTKRNQYQAYINLATSTGHASQVVEMHGQWGSIHQVPDSILEKMKQQWEPHRNG